MNNYKKLLYEICKTKNLTLTQGLAFLVRASKGMRKINFPVDSIDMEYFMNSVVNVSADWTEVLWELTETPHKIIFTGTAPSGCTFSMSLYIENPLKELEQFHKLVKRTISITATKIVEI